MLVPGATFGRYRVEAKLGEGGMGAVYRARDTLLRRDVALKILSGAALGRDPADVRGRILREARAAAALRHPSAVAVFDVGEVGDTPFLAMELLHGASLRDVLAASTPPLEARLEWLRAIADVLAAAHDAGLVHRDVKPENVMVCDDGAVKVLDFGIATRASDASPESLGDAPGPRSLRTAEGRVAGTPRYMAPEQRQGHSVDGRTDQFAWGLVAFETIVGTHPDDATDVAAALGRAVDAGLPEAFAGAITRALAREPGARFPSMGALLAHVGFARARPSGVLPAAPPEGGLGLATTQAADDPALASTEVARPPTDEREPVPASTQSPEAAPRRPVRALALVALVALGLSVVALGLRGSPRHEPPPPAPSGSAAAAPHVPDPAAHADYLRGRYLWNQRTEAGLRKAIAAFEESIAKDPRYAAPYVGLAESYAILPYMSDMPEREAEAKVRAANARALELDPSSPEAHRSHANALFEYAWDFPGSERAFLRSLELDPKSAATHQWYGELLSTLGRHDEAIARLRRAIELDPVHVPAHKNFGRVLLFARRYDEAEAALRRTLELDAAQPYTHYYLALALAERGRHAEARDALAREEATATPAVRETLLRSAEVHLAARAGRRDEAGRLARAAAAGGLGQAQPFLMAYVHALVGEREAMYAALERAIATHTRWTPFFYVSAPFDPYRDEARMVELARGLGLAR